MSTAGLSTTTTGRQASTRSRQPGGFFEWRRGARALASLVEGFPAPPPVSAQGCIGCMQARARTRKNPRVAATHAGIFLLRRASFRRGRGVSE
jgi:hypothetical protein